MNYLGPSDFHHDALNATIRTTDIILSFTDVLLKVYLDGQKDEWSEFGKNTFGGSNFDVDFTNSPIVTNELHTKMKYREDCHYFLRVTNEVNVVNIDKSIIIRKPAQNTESQFDESQIIPNLQKTNSRLTAQALSEKIFCHCGWPYNMILPKGTKGKETKFKMIVFISDGTNDMVPLYDQCGSMVLCRAEKWYEKFPDIRPMGYPFNRPFKDGSYEKLLKDYTMLLLNMLQSYGKMMTFLNFRY
ncbi:46330_t:CDS:2 [Gigaspora margarita]|uniref:46330_t:CDS:1 n=1 Tax=Gigaspora margarita TaxID=4874 RepID=A0ABN7UES6_GIGMA|nr:46330_t:CDS:2 [Gigaspora margarita]